MQPGHTFTIEPMICLGSNVPVAWQDDWTQATADGQPTAQFEHTLLITETGVEALTGKLPTSPKYSWEL
jgi:methionyl aminopeptidase